MAERGVAEEQFKLGLKYANGVGVAQNYEQAGHWYLKAAEQNHLLAQYNLGMMHGKGQGMPQSDTKSQEWFQKAADLGDAGAQYRICIIHQRAIRDGLPEDAAESRRNAYQWLRLAANQGYHDAESACEQVNLNMTREEVMEGGRRVAAFNAAGLPQNQ